MNDELHGGVFLGFWKLKRIFKSTSEKLFYPAKIFLLILKNYGRPIFQWAKFSFESFLKISGQ